MLTCLDPRAEEPALLWNGLIGVRIGRGGTGVGPRGPLPFFEITTYEVGGEEKMIPMTSPLLVVADVGSNELFSSGTPRDVSDYRQQLDMRTGILSTTWTEQMAGMVSVETRTVMHPNRRVIAQSWSISSDRDADISVGFGPGGSPATPQTPDWGAARQLGSGDELFAPKGGLGYGSLKLQARRRQLSPDRQITPKGKAYRVELTWSFGSDPPPTYGEVEQAAKAAWSKRWKTDIEIEGPVEDQQAIRSFLFYLRSAIHPDGGMSISPFGLSNATYNGHVFWDADIWVFPALALVAPDTAKTIVDYRLQRQSQAQSNFRDWIMAERPTAAGKLGPLDPGMDLKLGVKYPWESSVTGRETVPGPSKFEDHITFSVAWAASQAGALGLAQAPAVSKLVDQAGVLASLRSTGGSEREVRATMSPDENHVGDNDLYTNLLAQWCMNNGNWERWRPAGAHGLEAPGTHRLEADATFKLPRDEKSFLTYDGDPVRSYKQAAAVLSIYPVQYPPAEKEARVMMVRFSGKTSKNGPAMSDSLHALIWARMGETDKAYDTWRHAWQDFVKEPFLLFAEKRNRKQTYFTTGAAGCLQTVLYGFLGFRIDSRKQDGANWSAPLALERTLSVKPNLPKAWKRVKFNNFTVLGRRYTLIATHESVRVIQGDR